MTGGLTEKNLQSDRAEMPERAGKREWGDTADAEHIDWGSVVTENHGPTSTRPPPEALFAKSQLPIADGHADVGVEELETVDLASGCGWGRGGGFGICDDLTSYRRHRRSASGVLEFAAGIDHKSRFGSPCGEAGGVVE